MPLFIYKVEVNTFLKFGDPSIASISLGNLKRLMQGVKEKKRKTGN